MLKVCLTGGACSGKSSAQAQLTEAMEERGYKVIYCPETATELILNGIIPNADIPAIDYQRLVLEKQLAKEALYDKVASFYDDKLIVVYDRGICDGMAYLDKANFSKLLAEKGMTIADAYSHYDCVCHLVTAAKGAVEHYVWNDPSKEDVGNNAARCEPPEVAAKMDDKTMEAWVGHPHLRVFDNSTSFEDKIKRLVTEICNVLGEPSPKEVERKFLIKMPTDKDIMELGCVSRNHIIQTYLTTDEGERRVRQRGTNENGYTFYYTEKRDTGYGEREEIERKITPEEYVSLLSEADITLHQISKDRYCFVYDNQYFEMDIYPFSKKYAIVEIELNDINEEVRFPDAIGIVKEVTDDRAYRNSSLAKTLCFEEERVKQRGTER